MIKDQRSRIKDPGSKIKDQGSRIKDRVLACMSILEGIRTWYQDCPSLRSKIYHFISVLQGSDQGSRIKDLGPCFGMNGHPRRATDVILRLSKSTIDFLSFYIGFVKEFRVKMVVFEETMTFVWCFMKKLFFRFFILIWGLCGDVLAIENWFFVIEKSICNIFL